MNSRQRRQARRKAAREEGAAWERVLEGVAAVRPPPIFIDPNLPVTYTTSIGGLTGMAPGEMRIVGSKIRYSPDYPASSDRDGVVLPIPTGPFVLGEQVRHPLPPSEYMIGIDPGTEGKDWSATTLLHRAEDGTVTVVDHATDADGRLIDPKDVP